MNVDVQASCQVVHHDQLIYRRTYAGTLQEAQLFWLGPGSALLLSAGDTLVTFIHATSCMHQSRVLSDSTCPCLCLCHKETLECGHEHCLDGILRAILSQAQVKCILESECHDA